jgi:hypothetical protein
MRRNILTYKAPPRNEGYDLICIHPNPRHKYKRGKKAQVRVQVKSRYQTDCNRSIRIREPSIGAFDFLVVAFLNIGCFYGRGEGLTGAENPEFYTLPEAFIRRNIITSSGWTKVNLRGRDREIEKYKDEAGFEQIAKALGIEKPIRRANKSLL